MSELHPLHVVRCRSLSLSHGHDLIGGNEQELGLWVDELADEPRTGDAVHLDVLTGDPFHGSTPFGSRGGGPGRSAE